MRYSDRAYQLSRGWAQSSAQAECDATSGDLDAQSYMAALKLKCGSYVEACRWYQRAAIEHEEVFGMIKFASLLAQGGGCLLNIDMACKWFKKGAESHDADDETITSAGSRLGQFHSGATSLVRDLNSRQHQLSQIDVSEAIRLWKVAANLCDADSAAELGVIYFVNLYHTMPERSGILDINERIKWFEGLPKRSMQTPP